MNGEHKYGILQKVLNYGLFTALMLLGKQVFSVHLQWVF